MLLLHRYAILHVYAKTLILVLPTRQWPVFRTRSQSCIHVSLSRVGLNNFKTYSNWRLFNHAYTVLSFCNVLRINNGETRIKSTFVVYFLLWLCNGFSFNTTFSFNNTKRKLYDDITVFKLCYAYGLQNLSVHHRVWTGWDVYDLTR